MLDCPTFYTLKSPRYVLCVLHAYGSGFDVFFILILLTFVSEI